MAIRFSLFGRRTRAPSAKDRQAYVSLNNAASETSLFPAAEDRQHIRDRARERLARADQALEQTRGAG